MSFAFPHFNGSTDFLAMKDQSDVGPLSCRVTFKPVSVRLQHGIRFFRHLKPAPPSVCLAAHLPKKGQYGVSTFRFKKYMELGSVKRGRLPSHKAVTSLHAHLRTERIGFPVLRSSLTKALRGKPGYSHLLFGHPCFPLFSLIVISIIRGVVRISVRSDFDVPTDGNTAGPF